MIEKLFENLDRWRHLPAYQLERRADVFFGAYLHPFCVERFGAEYSEVVIPEFPLKLGIIWPGSSSPSKSVKVDYLLFAPGHALFVELKTDAGSRRDTQDEYLVRAEEIGLAPLLEGVVEIARVSSYTDKYMCLLAELGEAGVLKLPDGFVELIGEAPTRRKNQAIGAVCVTGELPVRVCFLQPEADSRLEAGGPDTRLNAGVPSESRELQVGFDEFAEWLEGRDELASTFAMYLRRWTRPAGEPPNS